LSARTIWPTIKQDVGIKMAMEKVLVISKRSKKMALEKVLVISKRSKKMALEKVLVISKRSKKDGAGESTSYK